MGLSPKTDSEVFFTTHPVFTVPEFDAFLAGRSGLAQANAETRQTLLRHHEKQDRILRVRRGLYAAVPPGQDPDRYPIDTYLIAARLTGDSVLAYHTALSLHGIAQSVREERLLLSRQALVRPLRFRGVLYRALPPPAALPADISLSIGVETVDRQGLPVRVTSLERTLVDVLDRPALSGGWEEVWRSLEGLETYLDFDLLTRYTLLLDNDTTAAKVGYFLEQGRKRLQVPCATLETLRAHAPKRHHPVERGSGADARPVPGWNLLLPSGFSGESGIEGEHSPSRLNEAGGEGIPI